MSSWHNGDNDYICTGYAQFALLTILYEVLKEKFQGYTDFVSKISYFKGVYITEKGFDKIVQFHTMKMKEI